MLINHCFQTEFQEKCIEIDAMEDLLEWIPMPVFLVNEDLQLTYCNHSTEAMYGYKKEDFVGQPLNILAINQEEAEKYNQMASQVFTEGVRGRIIRRHKTKCGEILDVDIIWNVVCFEKQKYIVTCIREFTEQKKLQDELTQKTKELEILANQDALTGAYNRLYFNKRFEGELARAKRYQEPLALLMIDIDNFKRINDKFGHLFGDMVLKSVAERINLSLRRSDVLVRFGGEEFTIIACNTDLEGAKKLAELLQQRVRATKIQCNGLETQVTISIGISAIDFCYKNCKIEDCKYLLVKDADDKLYKAKNSGRNAIEY